MGAGYEEAPDVSGLKGRCAFVLGGGGGLGGAIARALSAEGARVAVADLREDAARDVADRIVADGGEGLPLQLDLTDFGSLAQSVEHARERYGDVDILINLTGGPPPTTAAGVDPGQWSEHFQSMVLGVIHLSDLVLDRKSVV